MNPPDASSVTTTRPIRGLARAVHLIAGLVALPFLLVSIVLAMALTQPTERDRMKADEEGFMAEHGHWGMRVDGVTVLEPKPNGCT